MMSEVRISEDVLRVLNENVKEDETIKKFLIDLIYEESSHPGKWHFKNLYKKMIENSARVWGGKYED